jgi:hypothetical protein
MPFFRPTTRMMMRPTMVSAMRATPKKLGWEQAANGFPEIPKGKTIKEFWYNPAIVPLWVVIGVAGGVCGGFMFKYFTSHTEVNWSKKNRMTHDNQGIGDVSSHNSHFGMRKANKHHVTMFPFAYEPMQAIIDKRYVEE